MALIKIANSKITPSRTKMFKNYKIEWNSFSDFLSESNKNLYDEKDFVDVTLVSDDLTEVEAHKTVLSNASPVLKKLLKIKPVNHPVLFLRGVQGKTLEAIVQFIYLGETTIQEDRIQEFANIANDLNIQELNNILPRIRASLPPAPEAGFKNVLQKPPGMTSSRQQPIVKREALRQETPAPQSVPQQQQFYPIATIKNEVKAKQKKMKTSKTTLVARNLSTPKSPAVETNNLSYLTSKSQDLKNLNSFFSEVKAESSSPAVLNRSLPFLSNTQHSSPVMETPEEPGGQDHLFSESQSLSFLLETQDGMALDIPDMTQEALSGHEVDFQKLIASDEAPNGQEHKMELPWKCEECDKGFLTDKELERHMEQHRAYRAHQVPTFPCDECPKVLASKSSRWSHKNTVHSKKKQGLEDKLFNGLNWF